MLLSFLMFINTLVPTKSYKCVSYCFKMSAGFFLLKKFVKNSIHLSRNTDTLCTCNRCMHI